MDKFSSQRAEEMGMNPKLLQQAWNVLQQAVDNQIIPGAVSIISRRGKQVELAIGKSMISDSESTHVHIDTIYDCASLTKVVVTLPLILKGIDQGLFCLDDLVSKFIPTFADHDKKEITIKHLLTHTSGLIAHCDMYSHGWTYDEIIFHICTRPLEYQTGTKVVYSCLGYILLGEIINRVFGLTLDQAAKQYLFDPIGMKDSQFCPPMELRNRIAATEFIEGEDAYRWGQVHDENALALGGISGNAGLFSTARDLIRYADMWLSGGTSSDNRILTQAVTQSATLSHTSHLPPGIRGLGWVLQGDPFDASGTRMSSHSYGHTGFTGTSLYVDPVNGISIVLLTNRVHFGRQLSIASLRASFHDAVIAAVEG